KCLEKDPTARFANAEDLSKALDSASLNVPKLRQQTTISKGVILGVSALALVLLAYLFLYPTKNKLSLPSIRSETKDLGLLHKQGRDSEIPKQVFQLMGNVEKQSIESYSDYLAAVYGAFVRYKIDSKPLLDQAELVANRCNDPYIAAKIYDKVA